MATDTARLCCAYEALTREIRRARVAIDGSGGEGTEGAQTVGRTMTAQATEAQGDDARSRTPKQPGCSDAGRMAEALFIEGSDGA